MQQPFKALFWVIGICWLIAITIGSSYWDLP